MFKRWHMLHPGGLQMVWSDIKMTYGTSSIDVIAT